MTPLMTCRKEEIMKREESEEPAEKKNCRDQRKIKKKILYIKAAERIMRDEGIRGLNIRKLASEVGLNSATLYSYFEDLDELVLFATFKFRKEYLIHLSDQILPGMSAFEQYVKLYEIYCEYAFEEPEIFFNMYFGKYSYKLGNIREEYYTMFPEESIRQTPMVQNWLHAKDVYEGEMTAVRCLAEEGVIKEENQSMVANMVVRGHASYMHDLFTYKHRSITIARHDFMDCLMHILKTN